MWTGNKRYSCAARKRGRQYFIRKGFCKKNSETNLGVVTEDGSVYTFVINYGEKAAILVYNLTANKKATMATYANGILSNRRTLWGVRDNSWNIDIAVIGTYIKDHIIYYQLRIKRNSRFD
jgi:hypothetical protein